MTKEEMEKQIHEFTKLIYGAGFADGYSEGVGDKHNINEEVKKARREGYDEGVKDGQKGKISEMLVDTYTQGLNDAWECARKLRHPRFGGFHDSEQKDIFGYENSDDVLTKFTASEAIAKIKEYEEKQKARSCSYLEDVCPYDVKCEECEIHWSIERARKKLKESK